MDLVSGSICFATIGIIKELLLASDDDKMLDVVLKAIGEYGL